MTPRSQARMSEGERGGGTFPQRMQAGEQPMTREQAARLKALAGEAFEPEAFHPGLTAAEAARRIKALEVKLDRMDDGPPHTI